MALEIDSDAYPADMLFDILNALAMPVFVYELNGDEQLPVFMNRQCLDLLEEDSLEDAIESCNGDFKEYVSPNDRKLVNNNDRSILNKEIKTLSYEYHIVTKNHRVRLIRVMSTGKRDSDGSLMVVNLIIGLGVRPDSDEVDVLDSMTGLISMQTFFKVMRRWRSKFNLDKDGSELAVLYLDVVNFRSINIREGITAGDAFLRSLGDQLRLLFPLSAISRFDVDHFAVLMHVDNLEAKAAAVVDLFNSNAPKGVGVRMGACVWDNHNLGPESVCNRAKAACDEGRKHVSASFTIYTDEMGRSIESSEYIVSNIDKAIDNRWIRVFYQPIIRSCTGHLCGMEALVRWDDPERGLLPPAVFIGALEESQQIWKLDLCVIKQVVSRIADRSRIGLAEIPISVNLSRIDFLSCDIFSEIESLVIDYGIPRRTLHIEVTESALVSQKDVIFSTLNRFRDAGYEVWMDDFGSGYSSLNLLKDYSFDVLKLDMAFLRKDTKRSRDIISSVVSMDNRIGIRTLAEGVETKEQAEFLRRIGCSKLQGYYFGKPLPFDETLEACVTKGVPIEDMNEKALYDAAASVNFLTDAPLTLYDYHDGHFDLLQVNDPALRMIKQYGAKDVGQFEDAVNHWNELSYNELDKTVRYAIKTGKEGEQAISFFGKDMLFRFRAVSKVEGHSLIAARYFDFSRITAKVSDLAKMTSSILEFYRNVFYVDVSKQAIQNLRFGNYITGSDELETVALRDENGEYSKLLPKVFEVDWERYAKFIDPDTLGERLRSAKGGVLRDVFRTIDTNGKYRWMEHMLAFVKDSNREQAIYGIRYLDLQSLAQEISAVKSGSYSMFSGNNENLEMALWDSLMPYIPLKLFWKDKDRRFVGASKAFLDYYGLSSVKDIMGKTDEDMNWHPSEEDYRQAESEILANGVVSINVPGKCINGGSIRSIHATKWPVYRGGEICGLMGYFLDDALDCAGRTPCISEVTPTRSRSLCTIDQFVESLLSCVADFGISHRGFGIIYVDVPELTHLGSRAGSEMRSQLTSACSSTILDVIANRGIAARLGVGRYGILSKYQSREEIQEFGERIRHAVGCIRKVGNYSFTMSPIIQIVYAEEVAALQKRLTGSLFAGSFADAAQEDDDTESRKALREVMNSVPIGCYTLGPDHTICYWNREAERVLGYSPAEAEGKSCANGLLRCSYVNGDRIPVESCPAVVALATGEAKTMLMFMRSKSGADVLIRNTLVPMKDKSGRVYKFVAMFVPLADESYDSDLVRKIYSVATKDSLTGLPGRKYMETCIDEALELHRRTGRKFALLFADIDNFHALNDAYGHKVGDKTLRAFGDALRTYGRKTDSFCRWGGDEFVGILQLQQDEDIKGASIRFRKIAESIVVRYGDDSVTFQVSIGVTVVRDDDGIKSLVDRADRYRYEAKGLRSKDHVVTDFDVK